jgi:murein DD-endopeptidase MepM/ murein hydrolase activator NlpD
MADWRTHAAIDIAAEIGTTVIAAASGTVKSVYSDDLYGTTVTIDHGGGLVSLYANLAALPAVSEGEYVGVGDVIGSVGATAIAEAGDVTHLHFAMIIDGSPVTRRITFPEKACVSNTPPHLMP